MIHQLNERLKNARKELSDAKRELQTQREMNEELSRARESKTQQELEYYKKLSEKHINECTALAQEVISLRSHLDNKENGGSLKKLCIDEVSINRSNGGWEEAGRARSNTSKSSVAKRHNSFSHDERSKQNRTPGYADWDRKRSSIHSQASVRSG